LHILQHSNYVTFLWIQEFIAIVHSPSKFVINLKLYFVNLTYCIFDLLLRLCTTWTWIHRTAKGVSMSQLTKSFLVCVGLNKKFMRKHCWLTGDRIWTYVPYNNW